VKEEAFKDVGGREGFVNVKANVNGSCWKLESGRAVWDSRLAGGRLAPEDQPRRGHHQPHRPCKADAGQVDGELGIYSCTRAAILMPCD